MGSYPTKAIKNVPEPQYYDLQEMVEEWAISLDKLAGNTSHERGRAQKDGYHFTHNYDKLSIDSGEAIFERSAESLNQNLTDIQYTTVIGETEFLNHSSVPQSRTFNAEGQVETMFSSELTRALHVQGQCDVSFDFDTKRILDRQNTGKDIKRNVTIREMHEGKLQWSKKDKLSWSASYPITVPPKRKVTAILLVTSKDEILEFTQPMTLRGEITSRLYKEEGKNVEFVRPVTAKIEKIVGHFLENHSDVKGFETKDDDKNGFVRFETKGTMKFCIGITDRMEISEEKLSK